MTIRTIPNFLMLDPADLGYPMSHERRMRAMLGRPDGWVLPDYGVGWGATMVEEAKAKHDGAG